jgi:hypothetical protein
MESFIYQIWQTHLNVVIIDIDIVNDEGWKITEHDKFERMFKSLSQLH